MFDLRKALTRCIRLCALWLLACAAHAQTCGASIPAGNRFPSGAYPQVGPPGPLLPATAPTVASVGTQINMAISGSSTPAGLTNVGYQWEITNLQFRPLNSALPQTPTVAQPGPWAFHTRNPSTPQAVTTTYTTVFDYTGSTLRPKGMSFMLTDVDNADDMVSVAIYSGGNLVTYTYALTGGFVRVIVGPPAPSGPYSFPGSGTSLSFNGTANAPNVNPTTPSPGFEGGLVTITADPNKLIDRVEVTRWLYPAGSTFASISIGNFCWLTNEGVTVAGNVFEDRNGLSDSIVNGTGTNAGSAGLTAYLVNNTGFIAAVSSVSASGTYAFSLTPFGTYSVVLSNTPGGTIGGTSAASLPVGWANTGEYNLTGAGSDGTPNGVSAAFNVATTPIATINFGIRREANLSVTKTNGTNTVASGSASSYTLTFANAGPSDASGATARDIPSVGLSNCSVISCTPSVSPPAQCPVGLPNLLGAGAPIPSFPAGSSLVFVVSCGVTATGL